MSKNHYLMTAAGTAQLEIDYLRDQLNQAKKQLKDVLTARQVLKSRGYFVDNLWHVDDVTGNYNCTQEQAQQVLEMALTNDATMEQIWLAIGDACDTLEIKSKED
jgi:5-bromo-4-chloroindolyl phosphate hydrolysis protein